MAGRKRTQIRLLESLSRGAEKLCEDVIAFQSRHTAFAESASLDNDKAAVLAESISLLRQASDDIAIAASYLRDELNNRSGADEAVETQESDGTEDPEPQLFATPPPPAQMGPNASSHTETRIVVQ